MCVCGGGGGLSAAAVFTSDTRCTIINTANTRTVIFVCASYIHTTQAYRRLSAAYRRAGAGDKSEKRDGAKKAGERERVYVSVYKVCLFVRVFASVLCVCALCVCLNLCFASVFCFCALHLCFVSVWHTQGTRRCWRWWRQQGATPTWPYPNPPTCTDD